MSYLQNFNYQIRGNRLKSERLKKNLEEGALARGVCLSVKNVREIEESHDCDSFYSFAIKVTAAKRIGRYLSLEESDFLEMNASNHEEH